MLTLESSRTEPTSHQLRVAPEASRNLVNGQRLHATSLGLVVRCYLQVTADPIIVTETSRDTSSVGDIAEIHIAAALMRAGHRVLRPLSSASRYDLVIDNDDGTFTRVQCKSGRVRGGSIVFRVYSVSGHRGVSVPYADAVDAFGVYERLSGACYLVPVSEIRGRVGMVCLRLSPARNGQRRGIHVASAFAIANDRRLVHFG